MDDLISRQAAIDAMNTRLEDIKLTWRGKVKKGEIAMYLDMRGVIETLPSAQPEYYDYSDIDDVWEYYAEEQDIKLTDSAKQLKDAMWVGYRKGKQDAQPDIIKCKDCKRHNIGIGDFREDGDTVHWFWKNEACPLVLYRGKAQGDEFDRQYCSYAEGRTDAAY